MVHGRKLALGVSALAVAGVTAATPAVAAVKRVEFRFVGRGYGHGIGMSQYGAEGAARAGMTAESIIAMYYPGTQLQQLGSTTVRVLLAERQSVGRVTASGPWSATNHNGVSTNLPADHYSVRIVNSRIDIRNSAGAVVFRSLANADLAPTGGTVLGDGSRHYRGALRLMASAGRFSTINVVNLEDYLRGVVPLEMPASWQTEALRAQAIAARSYGMATRRSGDFDMYADTRSQMYGGIEAEHPATNAAVTSTKGIVATWEGRVATTFFSSTSGGLTESVENAWGGSPVPYLVSVKDVAYDRISPVHKWKLRDQKFLSDVQVARALGLGKRVVGMSVIRRTSARRAVTVRIVMANRQVRYFSGSTIRWKLGLRSNWFYQYRGRLGRWTR